MRINVFLCHCRGPLLLDDDFHTILHRGTWMITTYSWVRAGVASAAVSGCEAAAEAPSRTRRLSAPQHLPTASLPSAPTLSVTATTREGEFSAGAPPPAAEEATGRAARPSCRAVCPARRASHDRHRNRSGSLRWLLSGQNALLPSLIKG